MTFKIALTQCGYTSFVDIEPAGPEYVKTVAKSAADFYKRSALEQIEKFIQLAKNAHASLIVFPEYMMCPHNLSDEIKASAEPIDGKFIASVCKMALEYDIWVICSMNEKNSNVNKLPYNTLVAISSNGKIQSSYRKVHLFDCKESKESNMYSPGAEIFSPLETPIGNIGLGTCYDLRFPEVARTQCINGAEILIYPSAWYKGVNKIEQWHALLKSRAIENTAYVVGVCRCDFDFVGNSCVYDPNGKLIALTNQYDYLLTADINLETLKKTREKMPVLEHAKLAFENI